MKEHKRIERLMLFSQVAKELNFSRAAEHMGISRGHLSEQIKYLERELGTNLLNRSTRHVSLTKEGEKVLASMDSIQNLLTTMERDIRHEKNDLEGELKITAPLLFAHRYLNDICDDFHQKNPQVSFALNTSYQSHDLNKMDFDIAFRATKNPPLDMVAKQVLTYQHLIVC
ncbi:MAG: LysR family transcriptional regulator, partial [Paraglaciecola sp.]|nr:LysR family transcriptional regulator [Paraglaciecola sp.]